MERLEKALQGLSKSRGGMNVDELREYARSIGITIDETMSRTDLVQVISSAAPRATPPSWRELDNPYIREVVSKERQALERRDRFKETMLARRATKQRQRQQSERRARQANQRAERVRRAERQDPEIANLNKIGRFRTATAAPYQVAEHYLEMSAGDLERAVMLYLEHN